MAGPLSKLPSLSRVSLHSSGVTVRRAFGFRIAASGRDSGQLLVRGRASTDAHAWHWESLLSEWEEPMSKEIAPIP